MIIYLFLVLQKKWNSEFHHRPNVTARINFVESGVCGAIREHIFRVFQGVRESVQPANSHSRTRFSASRKLTFTFCLCVHERAYACLYILRCRLLGRTIGRSNGRSTFSFYFIFHGIFFIAKYIMCAHIEYLPYQMNVRIHATSPPSSSWP